MSKSNILSYSEKTISFEEIKSYWNVDIRRLNRINFCLENSGCYKDKRMIKLFAVVNIPQSKKSFTQMEDTINAARPFMIKAVNLLSFVLDLPAEIADFSQSRIDIVEKDEINTILHQEKTSDQTFANSIASKIASLEIQSPERAKYIWSMLENYRRSLAISNRSETDEWQTPEAMLGFFKIVELLGSYYSNDMKQKAVTSVKNLLREYLHECFSESRLDSETLKGGDLDAEKIAVTALTSNSVITQRMLILHALRCINLLNDRTSHYVGEVVRMRNKLAHAELVRIQPYRSGFHPPYYAFPEIDPDLWNFTKALAREAIVRFIGIKDSFPKLKRVLVDMLPAPSEIDEFIDKHRAKSLPQSFYNFDGCRVDGIELWHILERRRGSPVLLPYLDCALATVSNLECKGMLLAEKLIATPDQSRVLIKQELISLISEYLAGSFEEKEISSFLKDHGVDLDS